MSNQLQLKGAQPSKPIRYAPLWTSRFFNGVVTQRSPLRGNQGHVEEEFYGQQNDCLIDGVNGEISSRLTLIRRPGNSVYNSQTFPAINRFYENRTSVFNASQTAATENIQVIADTASVVYDSTGPSTKTSLFTKTTGAGSTYFQSVGNSLYFTDGPDRKKLLTPSLIWAANQMFSAGNWILDPNGNIQEVTSATISDAITEIAISSHTFFPPHSIVTLTLGTPFPVQGNIQVSLVGLTTVSSLNGTTPMLTSESGSQVTFNIPFGGPLATTPETGTVTYTPTTFLSSGSTPAWNATPGGLTGDGTIVWQNMGKPVQNWQIAQPMLSPSVVGNSTEVFWAPQTAYFSNGSTDVPFIVIDTNGNYESAISVLTAGAGGAWISGNSEPRWSTDVGGMSTDGNITWQNVGVPNGWLANFDALNYVPFNIYTPLGGNGPLILDSNGNIQQLHGGTSPFTTGSSAPAWSSTLGVTTSDNLATWICVGPGTPITTSSYQWAYSYHGVDGSLTTSSPVYTIFSGILGNSSGGLSLTVSGPGTTDPQCDQIWIWRTVQGGSILFFDSSIPNPGAGTSVSTPWTYTDTLLDSSTNGGPSLNELIEAPIAESSNPPPVGLGFLTYHLGCIFGAIGSTVYYSDGPLVTSGNGNTAWNPGNVFQFPSSVYRLFPTASGLLVFTSSNIYIIQGTNTPESPLFATPFLPKYLGLLSYDAFDVNGSIVYLYTTDNQIVSLDPSSGVSEIGFPIGDQFGPSYGTETFTPMSTHVTWHVAGSQDKGLYVSDFQGTWWRMCPTPSPETGVTWSPKAEIVGGFSTVQSVEVVPGTHQLLLGPSSSGPILKRDYSVSTDNGSAYDAWSVLGSMVLAQPGQLAMVESFTTDSIAIGTPPTLAIQLDEISSFTGLSSVTPDAPGSAYAIGNIISIPFTDATPATAKVTSVSGSGGVTGLELITFGSEFPASASGVSTTGGAGVGLTVNFTNGGLFESLTLSEPDPTQLEPSRTVYAQRFYLSQTQQPAVCRHLQVVVDWGEDSVMNELLSLSVFGAWDQEK